MWMVESDIEKAREYLLPGEAEKNRDRRIKQVYRAEKKRKGRPHRATRFPMITSERKPDRVEMNW
jgi:hypothetical protein